MEDKTQLPENILLLLEVKAKQIGKPLNEVIKEDYTKLVVTPIKFQYIKAMYDYKSIKKNDILLFNFNYTELENRKIYLIVLEIDKNNYLLYAEYDKELNSFVFDEEIKRVLGVVEDVKVLAKLTQMIREFDL